MTEEQSVGQEESRGQEQSAGKVLARIVGGDIDAGTLKLLFTTLADSAKGLGGKAVTSGKLAADLLVDAAGDLPARSHGELVADYGPSYPAHLASEVITSASRLSAAAGAASGALTSLSELAPPAWAAIPLELVVGTIAESAIELRMVAELHNAYQRPLPGEGRSRGEALLRLWGERRGVTAVRFLTDGPDTGTVAGGLTKDALFELVKKQVAKRIKRNLVSLGPAFIGAAANAELNRRSTRKLGHEVAADLHNAAWHDWSAWQQWQAQQKDV